MCQQKVRQMRLSFGSKAIQQIIQGSEQGVLMTIVKTLQLREGLLQILGYANLQTCPSGVTIYIYTQVSACMCKVRAWCVHVCMYMHMYVFKYIMVSILL